MPSDQTAWEGESVSFPCEAEGTPKPIVFWTMEGSQVRNYYNFKHIYFIYIFLLIVVSFTGTDIFKFNT